MPPAAHDLSTTRRSVPDPARRRAVPGAPDLAIATWTFDPARRADGRAFVEHRGAQVVDALERGLGAYGDPRAAIERCLDDATAAGDARGGSVTLVLPADGERGAETATATGRAASTREPLAVAVTLRTGMRDYIPGTILVYIAVDPALRGRGIGSALLDEIADHADGDVALHVEPDNPAKRLYRRAGYRHLYDEMRLQR